MPTDRNLQTGWSSLPPAQRQAFQRVIGTGSALYQDLVNRVIQQNNHRQLGALSVLPRRPGQGVQASIRSRVANAAPAAWIGQNAASTGTSDPTYATENVVYRTLSGKGTISRLAMAAGRGYADVLAEEMMARVEDFQTVLSGAIITGDDNAGASNQPKGLIWQNSASTQAALSGATATWTLDLTGIDLMVERCKGSTIGSDCAIITSRKGARLLDALLQGNQQFNDVTEIAAGFKVRTYQGIPIIVDSEYPDDISIDDTNPTFPTILDAGGGVGLFSGMSCINLRHVWLEELTPLTVQPMAQTDAGSQIFDLYWDGTPVWANPAAVSSVYFLS